jgi:diketogulonate reductase-like aldo/keto reductase
MIGQGTWEMERDPKASVEALRRGFDLGMTHIDTAEIYGSGAVERIVRQAINGRRGEVFLVSKVGPHNASRRRTLEACEGSLARLGTDYLDVYLLHWPSWHHPLEDTITAFKQLQQEGKIRHFGVSNFDTELLEEAISIAGPEEIVCNQVIYNLKNRSIESELIPLCKKNRVAVVGYSPFGKGDFPAGNQTLKEIAQAHDATLYQVALKFLTRIESTFAIPKASRVQHVESNASADTLELGQLDVQKIDAAFPVRERRRFFG